MKVTKTTIILTVSLIANIAIITMVGFKPFDNPKIGYINTQIVFEKFLYKKELEAKLKVVTEQRKAQLDSLEFELRLLAKRIESEGGTNKENIILFDTKREEYFQKKEQIEEDNSLLASKYDQQIFEQLNQYVSDYGEANQYKFILGNDGSGNIMYAKKADNVTEEVIDFINKKYNGIN